MAEVRWDDKSNTAWLDSTEREAVSLVMQVEDDLRANRIEADDFRAVMGDLRAVFGESRLEAIKWGVAVQQNGGGVS